MAVFFDLGQTLGFECRPLDPSLPIEFHVYDEVPQILQQLRDAGFRLGLLTVGSRWENGLASKVLQQSGLAHSFDTSLETHWAVDSATLFQSLAAAVGEPCVFVSPSRQRRRFAEQGGMRPVPHPALAHGVARGGELAYLRATGPRFDTDKVRSLCRSRPVAVPMRVVARGDSLTLYVATVEGSAEAVPPARTRLSHAGMAVEPLEHATGLDTKDLGVVARHAEGEVDAATSASDETSDVVCVESDAAIVALDETLPGPRLRGGCCGAQVEMRPSWTLLAAPRWPDPYTRYELSLADEGDLDALKPALFEEYLSPWWAARGIPQEGEIRSRDVLHLGNGRAVRAAARMLAGICGSANVRLCGFEYHSLYLQNVDATIPGRRLDEIVVVGAHIDSVNSAALRPQDDDAPGVDDDASGIAGLLCAAHVLGVMAARRQPERTIRFVLFNAEEPGLHGSRRYAADRTHAGERFVAMFQMDMIGLPNAGPHRQCEVHTGPGQAFSDPQDLERLRNLCAQLGEIVTFAASRVAGSLRVQTYPIAPHCNDMGSHDSDHVWFFPLPCPACKVCEDFYEDDCPGKRRNTNQRYHTIDDVCVKVDYAAAMARTVAAAAWMRANAT